MRYLLTQNGALPEDEQWAADPDYALWYGWSEMVRDLQHLREEARNPRDRAATAGH